MKGMIGRGIQRVVRGRTIAFACAGALFAAGSSAAFAQGLAAVPNTMAPIYMNNTIGLVGISGARQAAEAAYGRRSSSPPIVQLCTATLLPGPLALTTSSTAVP